MSAARAKGTAWETAIVTYLRASGFRYAERRAMNGTNDRGDIAGVPGVVIEAKSCKTIDVPGWLREANQEALNAHVPVGVVWFKRAGKSSPGDGWVVMDANNFAYLCGDTTREIPMLGVQTVKMTGAAFVAILRWGEV